MGMNKGEGFFWIWGGEVCVVYDKEVWGKV